MPEKRARNDGTDAPPAKKQRKGFQVGPANLPDGSWRRKNDKIKAGLIEKAKIKKEYAKLKQREQPEPSKVRYEEDMQAESTPQLRSGSPNLELHPDRQNLISGANNDTRNAEEDDSEEADEAGTAKARPAKRKSTRPAKPVPFARETRHAEQRQKEAADRAEQWEKSRRERAEKLEDREKFRRAMAKARAGGKNGQRKLGRESSVLLAKVKRMVGKA